MSLVTVGSVAFDALETPFGKTDKIIGGAATYITLSASYFVEENNLVAVVGDDFPQTMIDDLNQHGVNTEGLQVRAGEKTFFWSGDKESQAGISSGRGVSFVSGGMTPSPNCR